MDVRLEFKFEFPSVGCFHKNHEAGNSHQWGEFRAALFDGEPQYQLWLMHSHIYLDMKDMLGDMQAAVKLLKSVQKARVAGCRAQPALP